jgi:hypothetical protein
MGHYVPGITAVEIGESVFGAPNAMNKIADMCHNLFL